MILIYFYVIKQDSRIFMNRTYLDMMESHWAKKTPKKLQHIFFILTGRHLFNHMFQKNLLDFKNIQNISCLICKAFCSNYLLTQKCIKDE